MLCHLQTSNVEREKLVSHYPSCYLQWENMQISSFTGSGDTEHLDLSGQSFCHTFYIFSTTLYGAIRLPMVWKLQILQFHQIKDFMWWNLPEAEFCMGIREKLILHAMHSSGKNSWKVEGFLETNWATISWFQKSRWKQKVQFVVVLIQRYYLGYAWLNDWTILFPNLTLTPHWCWFLHQYSLIYIP